MKVVILVRLSKYSFLVGLSGVVGFDNFRAIHWSFVASHQRFEHFVKGKTRFVKVVTLAKMLVVFLWVRVLLQVVKALLLLIEGPSVLREARKTCERCVFG